MASPTSGADIPPVLPSIPLAREPVTVPGNQSISGLVKEARDQAKSLVGGVAELAKAEIAPQVKTGVVGGVFFIVALVIFLFSLFFLFFALGEILAIWLPRWAAFSIVFGIMLLATALAGLLGFLRVRRLGKPALTIEEVRRSVQVLSRLGRPGESAPELNGHGAPRAGMPRAGVPGSGTH